LYQTWAFWGEIPWPPVEKEKGKNLDGNPPGRPILETINRILKTNNGKMEPFQIIHKAQKGIGGNRN